MTSKQWEKLIKKQLSALGQEEKAYDSVVSTLADVLAQRDAVYEQYKEEGCVPVLEHTNNRGSSNVVKNPLVVLWDDLNKSALAYWRELGLTPTSYKKMTGDAPKKEKPQGLVEVLSKLEAS